MGEPAQPGAHASTTGADASGRAGFSIPRGFQNGIAGVVGGSLAVVVCQPLDVLKTRSQVYRVTGGYGLEAAQWRSSFRAARAIAAAEGPRAFYQGTGPALVAGAGCWAAYFHSYHFFKDWLAGRRPPLPPPYGVSPEHNGGSAGGGGAAAAEGGGGVGGGAEGSGGDWRSRYLQRRTDLAVNLGSAAMAGGLVSLASHPLWLVKTRLELQVKRGEFAQVAMTGGAGAGGGGGGGAAAAASSPIYNSTWDALRKIARQEGVRTFVSLSCQRRHMAACPIQRERERERERLKSCRGLPSRFERVCVCVCVCVCVSRWRGCTAGSGRSSRSSPTARCSSCCTRSARRGSACSAVAATEAAPQPRTPQPGVTNEIAIEPSRGPRRQAPPPPPARGRRGRWRCSARRWSPRPWLRAPPTRCR
jgi:hypothetical protein